MGVRRSTSTSKANNSYKAATVTSSSSSTTAMSSSSSSAAAITVRRVATDVGSGSSSVSRCSSGGSDTQHKYKRKLKTNTIGRTYYYRKNVTLSWVVLLGIISVSRILWGSFVVRKQNVSTNSYWQNHHQQQQERRQQQRRSITDSSSSTQHKHRQQLLRPKLRRSSPSSSTLSFSSSESSSSSTTTTTINDIQEHASNNLKNRHITKQSASNDRTGQEHGQHTPQKKDVEFQASETTTTLTTTSSSTTNQRRRNYSSRPTIISNDHETITDNGVDWASMFVESSVVYPTLNDIVTTTTISTVENQHQQLHGKEEYTSSSKIMISGLLVHPVAIELAINMTERFQIQNMVGMSKIPTTVSQSLRLEFLMRKVPNLQIELTQYYPPTEQQIHNVIRSFQPTHIFHFVEDFDNHVDGNVNNVDRVVSEEEDGTKEEEFHDDKTWTIEEDSMSFHDRSSSSSRSQPLPPSPPFLPSIHKSQCDLSILNGICKSLVKLDSDKNGEKATITSSEQPSGTRTKLIVVTTNVLPTDINVHSSSSSSLLSDLTYHASNTRQTLHSTLLQTYRLHYHLNIRQINLPRIFGPFDDDNDDINIQRRKSLHDDSGGREDEKNFVSELMNDVVPSSSSLSDISNTWLLHVADAVDKISFCGGLQDERITSHLPVLSVKDSETVTRNQLAVSLQRSLTMNNTTSSIDTTSATAIQQVYLNAMISWFVIEESLHGRKNSIDKSSSPDGLDDLTSSARLGTSSILSTQNFSDIVSIDERRRYGLFPCLSECASTLSDCTEESVWTVDTISASRLATEGCRYLLYMVDFSRDLKKIQVLKESPDAPSWPKNLFCQVAFVTKRSPVVLNAIETWYANATDNDEIELNVDRAYREQNGLLSIDGWRLVWIDRDEDLLSEADLMLPKLAPGGLLSTNVTKAFYVELEHLQTIPPLQVVWFLMARKLDTKALPSKRVRETRAGTSMGRFIDAPPVPARHVALFAHKFYVPPEIAAVNDDKLISFILKQKGRKFSRSKQTSFRRQWEAYGHSLHFWGEGSDPKSFRVVDTALIIHQIGSSQSGRLRCEWYEEHLFWNDRTTNSNRYLEDVSLSYVLSRRRRRGWLEYFDDNWGDKMIEDNFLSSSSNSSTANLHEYFVSLHNPIKARKEY